MKKFFLKNKDLDHLKSKVSKLENANLKNAALDTLCTNEKFGGAVYDRVVWGKWSKVVVHEA
jgi:hypothetical protein